MKMERIIEQYAGRIDVDARGPARTAVLKALAGLFEEWDPIDSSPKNVRLLMGRPTRETEEELVYIFDSGRGGPAWKFLIEKNRVVKVEQFSVN